MTRHTCYRVPSVQYTHICDNEKINDCLVICALVLIDNMSGRQVVNAYDKVIFISNANVKVYLYVTKKVEKSRQRVFIYVRDVVLTHTSV